MNFLLCHKNKKICWHNDKLHKHILLYQNKIFWFWQNCNDNTFFFNYAKTIKNYFGIIKIQNFNFNCAKMRLSCFGII